MAARPFRTIVRYWLLSRRTARSNRRLLLTGVEHYRLARSARMPHLGPQQKRRSFYESDCQGQTRSRLIARISFPWQSALIPAGASLAAGAFGCAGQSASASGTSCATLDPLGRSQALGSRTADHGSIGDSARRRPGASSGLARGPTVRRVPRQIETGLTTCLRLPPAPLPGASGVAGEEPSLASRDIPPLSALAASAESDRSVLLFSTAAA